MAFSLSQLFPISSPFSKTLKPNLPTITLIQSKPITLNPKFKPTRFPKINAIEDPKSSGGSSISSEESETLIPQNQETELSEFGAEIKKAMKEREEETKAGEDDNKNNLWSGVAEEIGEIEWPPFNKVVGTTGVVLGVIVGSSIVLLTVNAVLAELSDQVFGGKGFQDFF